MDLRIAAYGRHEPDGGTTRLDTHTWADPLSGGVAPGVGEASFREAFLPQDAAPVTPRPRLRPCAKYDRPRRAHRPARSAPPQWRPQAPRGWAGRRPRSTRSQGTPHEPSSLRPYIAWASILGLR